MPLVCLLSASGACALSLNAQESLTIGIHNLSAAGPRDIADLREAATAIFEHARIKPVWADCRRPTPAASELSACQQHSGAVHITLLLVDDRIRTGFHAIGWTTLGTHVCTVHFRQSERMARASTLHLSSGQVMGNTAAHEIGHLVLGETNHSLFGIMKPAYDSRDLLAMAQGRLHFTEEDAQRFRVRLRLPSPAAP